jgi:hypothetical protein
MHVLIDKDMVLDISMIDIIIFQNIFMENLRYETL